jgi:dynactin complex subunit
MNKEKITLKKKLVELEFQLSSCKDRVRDLEWEIEMSEPGKEDGATMSARRRALDKIKYIYVEMEKVKIRLIDLESTP